MPKIYDENGIATEIDDSIYYSLEDLPGEEWKDIVYKDPKKGVWVDFRGKYQMSNKGRVKSLARHSSNGHLYPDKILSNNGEMVNLYNDNINARRISTVVLSLYSLLFKCSVHKPQKCLKTICITTGDKYPSIYNAHKQTGVDRGLISEVCKHERPYAGRLVDGKIISDCRNYQNQGIPLIWRYMEDVIYEG